jgi:hypothetical protein
LADKNRRALTSIGPKRVKAVDVSADPRTEIIRKFVTKETNHSTILFERAKAMDDISSGNEIHISGLF